MSIKNQTAVEDRKKRNSSFELLRIISMVMIVFYHFAIHGGFEFSGTEFTIPYFWYSFILMGGKIGVDVFVLISGYFMINSNGSLFNFKRILKFWGQIAFYSIILCIVFGILGISELNLRSLVKACFPITCRLWWFASTYFVLYLLHPFLNILLNAINKKTYQTLLVMTVIFWSIIPTITTKEYEGNKLLWFITLYAIAGYINKFGFNKKLGTKHYLILLIIFSVLTYLLNIAVNLMASKWTIFSAYSINFYEQYKFYVLLISLTLFMMFATMNMKHSKIINTVASATFGVYLIHDHMTSRQFLWIDLFKDYQFQHSNMIIPYSVMAVISVYVVCTLIDLIRQIIFEKPYIWIVNKYSQAWLKPFERIFNYCKAIVFGDD